MSVEEQKCSAGLRVKDKRSLRLDVGALVSGGDFNTLDGRDGASSRLDDARLLEFLENVVEELVGLLKGAGGEPSDAHSALQVLFVKCKHRQLLI